MPTPRRLLARAVRALLIAGVVGTVVISTAFAGKPGATSTTSSFRVPDGVYAGTSTATGATSAWVRARCYQGGTLVYEQYVKVADGSATLTLGPTPSWTGGGASCSAQNGYFSNGTRWRVAATASFNVSG